MQKRTLQPIVILLLLLTLTGCASIQARVSDCQQMLSNTFSANNRIPRQEREVLLTLNEMSQGSLAPAATGTFPCRYVPLPCQWPGVTCSSGHVAALNIDNRNLSGEIPPELNNLPQLRELNLGANQLSGEIPPELGDLSQLGWLYLYENQLSGEIPPELGNLSRLGLLDLAGNQLSGKIPPELGNLSELTILSLNDNQLSGEIPAELGSLPYLSVLRFSNNSLSGPLPHEISKLTTFKLSLSNTDLCIPQTAEFEAWLASMSYRDFDEVPYCE